MQFCKFTNLMRSFINANPKNQRNGGNMRLSKSINKYGNVRLN